MPIVDAHRTPYLIRGKIARSRMKSEIHKIADRTERRDVLGLCHSSHATKQGQLESSPKICGIRDAEKRRSRKDASRSRQRADVGDANTHQDADQKDNKS